MKEPIYYYKTVSGTWYFSNGQVKTDEKAGQYLRMLRYAGYPTEALYLDRPSHFERAKELFHIEGKTWREVYYER